MSVVAHWSRWLRCERHRRFGHGARRSGHVLGNRRLDEHGGDDDACGTFESGTSTRRTGGESDAALHPNPAGASAQQNLPIPAAIVPNSRHRRWSGLASRSIASEAEACPRRANAWLGLMYIMEPTLTWLDLTVSDRDKMRRVLDLFKEQGTIDEMGLGGLRDILSDALFPGTSYIQTRLRYMVFIPWMYQRLESRKVGSADVAQQARKAEADLIGSLADGEDAEGVIGVRARGSLARLPSSVYWSALVRWRIFRHPRSQGWYHANFARLADRRDPAGRSDDPGVVWTREPSWHPRLPGPPASFPQEASFALTRHEADFLRGRLEEQCAGTLLGWLARKGSDAPAEHFWDDPDAGRASEAIRATVELARRFSLHVQGIPLLYNLLLAKRRHTDHGGDGELIDGYRAELAEWAASEAEEDTYDPHVLWDLVVCHGGRSPDPQRRFVEAWSKRIAEKGPHTVADDDLLCRLVADRERRLKGPRARLVNPNQGKAFKRMKRTKIFPTN